MQDCDFPTPLRKVLSSLVLFLALARAAAAQDPGFLIERFAVSGVRYASPRIIVAESRLREGRSYSESELAAAIGRIERLPFVVFADFRLEKGTVPGQYVLAISIAETKPLFLSARSYASWVSTETMTADPTSLPAGETPEPQTSVVDYRNDYLTVGGRWFIGARGVVHVAAELQREDRYSIGYTHYDVFGTRASITALVAYQNRRIEGLPGLFGRWERNDDLTYQALASVPITANQSIRASWQHATQPVPRSEPSAVPGNLRYTLDPAEVNRYEMGWAFDTTNDALFPTRGTLITASAAESEFAFPRQDGGLVFHDRTVLSLTADRYIPVTWRQTLTAGADLHRRGIDEARAHAGYSASLWKPNTERGDFRFEAQIDRTWLLGPGSARTAVSAARAGFAFRNAWGLLRLDFEYVGWRDSE